MNCLLRAAGMAFGCKPDDIINFLGHDGSEKDATGEARGFHIQEIARFAFMRKAKNLVPIEPEFGVQTQAGKVFHTEQRDYFNQRLAGFQAILEGYTPRTGHACYWNGERSLGGGFDFKVTCAWLIL